MSSTRPIPAVYYPKAARETRALNPRSHGVYACDHLLPGVHLRDAFVPPTVSRGNVVQLSTAARSPQFSPGAPLSRSVSPPRHVSSMNDDDDYWRLAKTMLWEERHRAAPL